MKLLFFALSFAIGQFAYAQSEITGVWLTQDKEAKVKIYEQNGKYYGKIIWVKNPKTEKGLPVLDDKNPVITLRKNTLIDLIILTDLNYEAKEWINGKLYDPENGKTYKSKIWLENADTLKVRGYIGLFYETEIWTRVK